MPTGSFLLHQFHALGNRNTADNGGHFITAAGALEYAEPGRSPCLDAIKAWLIADERFGNLLKIALRFAVMTQQLAETGLVHPLADTVKAFEVGIGQRLDHPALAEMDGIFRIGSKADHGAHAGFNLVGYAIVVGQVVHRIVQRNGRGAGIGDCVRRFETITCSSPTSP